MNRPFVVICAIAITAVLAAAWFLDPAGPRVVSGAGVPSPVGQRADAGRPGADINARDVTAGQSFFDAGSVRQDGGIVARERMASKRAAHGAE